MPTSHLRQNAKDDQLGADSSKACSLTIASQPVWMSRQVKPLIQTDAMMIFCLGAQRWRILHLVTSDLVSIIINHPIGRIGQLYTRSVWSEVIFIYFHIFPMIFPSFIQLTFVGKAIQAAFLSEGDNLHFKLGYQAASNCFLLSSIDHIDGIFPKAIEDLGIPENMGHVDKDGDGNGKKRKETESKRPPLDFLGVLRLQDLLQINVTF